MGSGLAESAQNAQAHAPALFGVKLGAVDISAGDGSGQRGAIGSGGNDGIIAVHGGIGMDEIDVVSLVNVAKKGGFHFLCWEIKGIPTDVRNLQPLADDWRNGTNLARNESKPLVGAVLVAAGKKHLHAEADAEQRFARSPPRI